MKRNTFLIIMAAGLLLTAACNPYSEHVLKGTLYSDSTMTTPLAGKTLDFYEGADVWRDLVFDQYLGHAETDANGRWAFQYIRNLDRNSIKPVSKLKITEYEILIVCDGDTLYTGSADGSNLNFYPGCWHNPYSHPSTPADTTGATDTTTTDTTAVSIFMKGGLK